MAGTARTPLDRGRVVRAAVDVTDRDGLNALSMRTLAAALGVVPMALYKHVADRDDLIGAMIDLVVTEFRAPDSGMAWQDAVRSRVLSAREALLRHPWFRAALETTLRQTPDTLAYMDSVAGEFIDGGLSVDLTHHAMHALGYRIWGFSPEAFSTERAPAPTSLTTTATAEPEQQAMMQQMAARYPNVAAIALDAATRNPEGACNDQSEFEFTLDLLLDAFQRLHERDWQSRAV